MEEKKLAAQATESPKTAYEKEEAENLRRDIKEAVVKNAGNVPKEQKQQFARLMLQVFEGGASPKEALNMSTREVSELYAYAYSLFSTGKYKEACEIFKFLLSLEPAQADFATALGVCHHRLKNYLAASAAYMYSYTLNDQNPVPLFYAYDCFINLKEPQSALIMLAHVINLSKDDPKYAHILKLAIMHKENMEKAAGGIEKAS